MRWLASRPRWLLAGAFVLLLVSVVVGIVLRIWILQAGALLVFVLYFAALMAFVGPHEKPRPRRPH